jgi:hypothetical protein
MATLQVRRQSFAQSVSHSSMPVAMTLMFAIGLVAFWLVEWM